MTRTAHRWASLPGNFDKLNTFMIADSDNEYGIPIISKDYFIPDWLVPYKQRIRTEKNTGQGAVHTFLDDHRFEHIWNRPIDTLSVVKTIGGALSPDFSIYIDYPKAVQIWNIYRSRWMGAFWQTQGVKVIPTISWADEESFEFCFLGVPENSIVAISTVGVIRNKKAHPLFKAGFLEMMKIIKPSLVLCYGEKAPFDIEEYTRVRWYPSYWKGIRDAMKGGNKDGR